MWRMVWNMPAPIHVILKRIFRSSKSVSLLLHFHHLYQRPLGGRENPRGFRPRIPRSSRGRICTRATNMLLNNWVHCCCFLKERCILDGTLTVNYEQVDVDYRLKHNDLLANIVHRYVIEGDAALDEERKLYAAHSKTKMLILRDVCWTLTNWFRIFMILQLHSHRLS